MERLDYSPPYPCAQRAGYLLLYKLQCSLATSFVIGRQSCVPNIAHQQLFWRPFPSYTREIHRVHNGVKATVYTHGEKLTREPNCVAPKWCLSARSKVYIHVRACVNFFQRVTCLSASNSEMAGVSLYLIASIKPYNHVHSGSVCVERESGTFNVEGRLYIYIHVYIYVYI